MASRTCVVSFALLAVATQVSSKSAPQFTLDASDKELAMSVPGIYTANAFDCTGGNLSPELHWRGAPPGTSSFVLTLFDPDEHSTPSGWWHWIVYDLPPTADMVAKGAGVADSPSLPHGTLQGRSDLGEDAYHGPCPAKGDRPHRYTFTLYALNVAKLPVPANSSGAMIVSTAQEHILGKAVFVAHYGR